MSARVSLKIYDLVSICCRSHINVYDLIRFDRNSLPRAIDAQLAGLKLRLFSVPWLEQPDGDGRFPTNADRFAAQELKKRQDIEGFTRTGFVCQAIAAGWHHKSAEQLKELGDAVGRERIQVMHGTVDNMIVCALISLLFIEVTDSRSIDRPYLTGKSWSMI